MKKYLLLICATVFTLCACHENLPQPPAPQTIGADTTTPNYLAVEHWKSCTKQVNQGSNSYVCLPKDKPQHFCRSKTWKKLHYLNPPLPACPETEARV